MIVSTQHLQVFNILRNRRKRRICHVDNVQTIVAYDLYILWDLYPLCFKTFMQAIAGISAVKIPSTSGYLPSLLHITPEMLVGKQIPVCLHSPYPDAMFRTDLLKYNMPLIGRCRYF